MISTTYNPANPLPEFFSGIHMRPGTVVHTDNPSTLGGQGGQITGGQEFETSLAKTEKPHLY